MPGERSNSCITINRLDLGAKDDEFWTAHITATEGFLNISAQNTYGNTMLLQNAAGLTLRVNEYGQWGQPALAVCSVHASTLVQLRAEHPQEFRLYVTPLLSLFTDLSFLRPGAADVYGVFTEIAPDQTVVEQVGQILSRFDADDPIDRDAASARLLELGSPAVLAALRWNDATLSEEGRSCGFSHSSPDSAAARLSIPLPNDMTCVF